MKKIKYYLLALIIASITIGVTTVKANPLFFPQTKSTATATTTINYMTAGTATTTLVYDSYTSGNPTGVLKGALLLQVVASSTNTTIRVNQEFSQGPEDGVTDCLVTPTACDWYQDSGSFSPNYSTSSRPFDLSVVNQYSLNFASSTAGLGAVSAQSGTTTRAISVNVPTRYTRFIFTIPVGSQAGGVWAKFVPVKERAQ